MLGPDDVRSYLFCLRPKDVNFKLDPYKDLNLGSLVIIWRNYFGDAGQLELSPINAKAKPKECDLELTPLNHEVLKFEQP